MGEGCAKVRSRLRTAARSLVLSTSVVLPAQEREVLVGQVLDAERVPIQGAVVHLVHRPAGSLECSEAGLDAVDVATDDQGRFRAEVLRDRDYSAFATRTDGEGVARATGLLDGLRAGETAVLWEPANDLGPLPLRVEVRGLAAWEDLGPFHFRVWPDSRCSIALPVWERDPEGLLVLPPLPGNRGRLQVLTPDGEVLFQDRVTGTAVWEVRDGPPRVRVNVDPPRSRSFVVVDRDTGEPIAGAELRQTLNELRVPQWGVRIERHRSVAGWRSLGVTDEGGRLEAQTCGGLNHMYTSEPVVCVTAPGRADAFVAWLGESPHVDAMPATVRESDRIEVPLADAQPVVGRLTWDGERPVVGAEVLVHVRGWMETSGPDSWPGVVRAVRTDERGRFAVASVPVRCVSVGVRLRVDAAVLRRELELEGGMQELLHPFGALDIPLAGSPRSADLGSASLGALGRVRLEVVDAEERPPRAGLVEVFPRRDNHRMHARCGARLDAGGRACLLLDAAEESLIVISDRDSGVWVGTPEGLEPVGVTLLPFTRLSGRLVDRAGTPVVRVGVYCVASDRSSCAADVARAVTRLNLGLGARTDEDGRFAIAVAQLEGVHLEAAIERTGARFSERVEIDLQGVEPGASVDLGELVLDR